jgi:hypothetical protein
MRELVASPKFSARHEFFKDLPNSPTTMVRIKNRYLLVNILYPELEKGLAKASVPDIVTFNQPTTDALTVQALLKGIRAAVSDLFGDYGSGATADSLASMAHFQQCNYLLNYECSQISITGDINLHPSRSTSTLPNCMGSAFASDGCTDQKREKLCVSGCKSEWYNQKGRGGGNS